VIWKLPSARWMVPSLLPSTPDPAIGDSLVSSGAQALAVQAEVVAVSLLKLYSVAVRAPPGNGLPTAARTVELPGVSLVTVIGPVTGTPVGARVSQTPKAGGSMKLSPLLVPDGVPAARSNANM
jgi:hypothetical protein